MLKLILVVLSLCGIARSASIAYLSETTENVDFVTVSEAHTNICLTQSCNETSAYISNLLDESVDPCDDFYQFACGTFLKQNLPEDKKEYSNFDTLQQNVYDQLHSVLSEPIHVNDSKAIALAKTYFESCMNKEAAEKQHLEGILWKIEHKFGGWPVVKGDQWDSTNFDWIRLLKNLSEEGFEINQIWQFQMIVGLDNSSRHILHIDRPKLNLKRSFLQRLREPYLSFMFDVAAIMGANRSRAETEMNDVLSFETQLLNASIPSRRISLKDIYNVMTFGELQEKFPYFNWLAYARTFMPNNVTIDENEPVAIGLLEFFERLEDILKNMNKRTVANYLIWRSIFTVSKYLNNEMIELSLKFSEILNGKKKQEPAHIECIASTTDSLPMPVGELYVKNFFDEESRTNANELVKTIRSEFINLLAHVDWMDNETRETAIEKARYMNSFVAYPNASYNNDFNLNEYYEGLELCADNLAENVLRIAHFDQMKDLSSLHKPIEGPEFNIRRKTAIVNAFYSPQANSLYLTAAILQQPFFDARRPSYVNYAKIGQFIGHEMTHAFDESGRIFDRFGDMVNWWRNDTNQKYQSKSRCFEEQFSAYETAAGDKLNGYNTLDENIADSGGIKVSYNAYQRFVDRNGPEKLLSGLNYTQNQLFWISSAQTWCSIIRPAYLKTFIATDPHAPHKFRAIGTISNMPNFAEDFKCDAGSKMNPNKRCQLW